MPHFKARHTSSRGGGGGGGGEGRSKFVAPLNSSGHIGLPSAWKAHREQCQVRQFWQGEADQHGVLLHKPGGSEHARWVFDYDRGRDDDDEAGLSLRRPSLCAWRISHLCVIATMTIRSKSYSVEGPHLIVTLEQKERRQVPSPPFSLKSPSLWG